MLSSKTSIIDQELNTVKILKGTRFGKSFTGTFYTKEVGIKSNLSTGKKYCPILLNGKSTWIAIQDINDCEFTLSTINANRLALAMEDKPLVEEGLPVVEETENQALDRIKHRFEILQRLVKGVCAGAIKALVVSGPPGVGKTHGIEAELSQQASLYNYKYEFLKGTASPIYLYQKLHDYADEKSILVIDDCDSVFFDPIALNLFKAALDSSKKRTITWGTESRVLKEKDIPNSFEFRGAIIFISNLKFDKVRSESLKEHLKAIESRCHYLDLTIDTHKDKMLRIKQVVRDSDMLKEYGFSDEKEEELVQYIESRTDNLRELSLRTIKKVADLACYTDDWKAIADVTCQRGSIFGKTS